MLEDTKLANILKNVYRALQVIDKPALVIVGDKDEEFDFKQYEPLFRNIQKQKQK